MGTLRALVTTDAETVCSLLLLCSAFPKEREREKKKKKTENLTKVLCCPSKYAVTMFLFVLLMIIRSILENTQSNNNFSYIPV